MISYTQSIIGECTIRRSYRIRPPPLDKLNRQLCRAFLEKTVDEVVSDHRCIEESIGRSTLARDSDIPVTGGLLFYFFLQWQDQALVEAINSPC